MSEMGVAFQRVIVLPEGAALACPKGSAWVGYVSEYTVEHNAAMGSIGTRVLMRVELHPESMASVQAKMRNVLGEVQLELAMGTPPSVT